ncbi:MAG: AAA family ATPase [Lutibacter sp.]|uniref:ATP-dependent nuclease n=1 Tax=Lutibacter sp. TaxID=1925666 RepID=UPI00299D52C7|nr:AAA family ATPase [Lutibacter sp.]MDX1830495.1 AAA family ATPase [Lutibacter sp.]
MYYKSIKIKGYRGFVNQEKLNLAQPNGENGSGLTIVVGPNNSGKSTIYESFRAIAQNQEPSFTEGKRNKKAGDQIGIILEDFDGNTIQLKTSAGGGSETEFVENGIKKKELKIFTLPSRRTFNPFFHKGTWNRDTYIGQSNLPSIRGKELENFNHRIFSLQKNQKEFNAILEKVITNMPEWYIDQNDIGNYYIKFNYNGSYHNSDGVGEGIISVFTIVDTLYDSEPGDTIIIDEPELSLHPSLQRRMSRLIEEYSKDRQIVISTHSPFFINWESIINGAELSRTVKHEDITSINYLTRESVDEIKTLLKNFNNPHILGINANEVFFLDDNIILVEGQEDVIFFKRIQELMNIQSNIPFFGWGAGGASNMDKILGVLKDLGFKKVSVIFDNNVGEIKTQIEDKFPDYNIEVIPTDDVRDKSEIKAKPEIKGLIDRGGKTIVEEHKESIQKMFENIEKYHK